ncbi:WhiB family transcriptional regulator [Streptomyces griseofuscus]|uniref:WhiB family transcriptional regulator n=1 Tax=Streptomycetaceae TaxID=2062 RepID=UPI00068FD1BC|nr:WhiB family transcriptional regulator [Actinacidiphila yeochonensis]
MTTAVALPHQDDTVLNCTTTDPEAFHDDAHAALAKKLCEDCPLAKACRSRARTLREWGTWGGETTAERAAAGFAPPGWRGRGHQRENRPCGTPAAYRRHIRAKEKPCTSCKAAESRRRAGSTRRPRRRVRRRPRTTAGV